jgi:hypothetical protein
VLLLEPGQSLVNDGSARPAEDVSDEEYSQVCGPLALIRSMVTRGRKLTGQPLGACFRKKFDVPVTDVG